MRPPPVAPPVQTWRPLLELALAEDVGSGDVTSQLVHPAGTSGAAHIEARESLTLAGLPMAQEVFRLVDANLEFTAERTEGEQVAAGAAVARLRGPVHAILKGERTALNLLSRLCGVATLAQRFVDAVAGTQAEVVDTRKTMPGWRQLDKYAAATGGATNHRTGLYDGILIKDNHIAAAGGVTAAIQAAVSGAPDGMRIQVEVENEKEAEEACKAGADFLLLDNYSVEDVRKHVERFGSRTLLEASGGITLDNIREYADTGVHRISVGAITHSALGSDLSLELRPEDAHS